EGEQRSRRPQQVQWPESRRLRDEDEQCCKQQRERPLHDSGVLAEPCCREQEQTEDNGETVADNRERPGDLHSRPLVVLALHHLSLPALDERGEGPCRHCRYPGITRSGRRFPHCASGGINASGISTPCSR